MKNNVKYAILKYVPNLERNETINIAIVLHYIDEGIINMTTSTNWKRVKSFDDEADIPFLKNYVHSLKEEFSMNLFNNFDGKDLRDTELLDEMTKYFVNKFVFEIHKTSSELKFDEFFDYLKRIYLYYDVNKKKRISEEESKRFIEQKMLESNVAYQVIGTKNAVQEVYGNNVNLDYKIDMTYYKIIFFNDNNYKNYVSMIKMWIANSIMLKNENKNLIFIIDEAVSNEKTDTYKKMLSDYGKIVDIKDFIKFENNIENKKS